MSITPTSSLTHLSLKLPTSFAVIFGSFNLGLFVAIQGPTLMDLIDLLHINNDTMSVTLAFSSLAYSVGGLLSGVLFNFVARPILITILFCCFGLCNIVTPFITNYLVFTVITCFKMICAGGTDCGASVWILDIWPGKDEWLQALHFTFAVGTALGPLIVEPFLSADYARGEQESGHSSASGLVGIKDKTSGSSTISDQNNETRIHVPFIFSGILSICAGLIILYLHLKSERLHREQPTASPLQIEMGQQQLQLQLMPQKENKNKSEETETATEEKGAGAEVDATKVSERADQKQEEQMVLEQPCLHGSKEPDQKLRDKDKISSQGESHEPSPTGETGLGSDECALPAANDDKKSGAETHSSESVSGTSSSTCSASTKIDKHATNDVTRSDSISAAEPDPNDKTEAVSSHGDIVAVNEQHLALEVAGPIRKKITSRTHPDREGRPPYYVMFAVALAAMSLSFYCGVEITSMNYLATFAVNIDLQLTKSAAALMSSALTISFAVGRGMGVYLAARMKSHHLFYMCTFTMIIGNVFMLIFANTYELLLWLSVCLFGLGCAPLYPAVVSFFDYKITKVTNTVSGIFISGSMFNVALNSLIIGHHIMDNALILLFCNLAGSIVLLFLFGTLHMLTKVKTNQRVRKYELNQKKSLESQQLQIQSQQEQHHLQSQDNQ